MIRNQVVYHTIFFSKSLIGNIPWSFCSSTTCASSSHECKCALNLKDICVNNKSFLIMILSFIKFYIRPGSIFSRIQTACSHNWHIGFDNNNLLSVKPMHTMSDNPREFMKIKMTALWEEAAEKWTSSEGLVTYNQ